MGQRNTAFTKDELDEYEELTYLSRSEILRAYEKFQSLDPIKVNKHKAGARVSCEKVRRLTKELRMNPFGDRVCEVFNTGGDDGMSFDDYLDMYSALGEMASRDVKTTFAFRVYDFDGDGLLGRDDIKQAIDRVVQDEDKHLTRTESNCFVENVLKEADNDEDGALCFPEFQQAMSKSPDFLSYFKLYI